MDIFVEFLTLQAWCPKETVFITWLDNEKYEKIMSTATEQFVVKISQQIIY